MRIHPIWRTSHQRESILIRRCPGRSRCWWDVVPAAANGAVRSDRWASTSACSALKDRYRLASAANSELKWVFVAPYRASPRWEKGGQGTLASSCEVRPRGSAPQSRFEESPDREASHGKSARVCPNTTSGNGQICPVSPSGHVRYVRGWMGSHKGCGGGSRRPGCGPRVARSSRQRRGRGTAIRTKRPVATNR